MYSKACIPNDGELLAVITQWITFETISKFYTKIAIIYILLIDSHKNQNRFYTIYLSIYLSKP